MRDPEGIGAASVTWETERPWQHSAMQIAITGQSFAWPEPSLWQGISSAAASITMSDDIACASATAIAPAAEAASGARQAADQQNGKGANEGMAKRHKVIVA
jgi:hypothetical protein